RISDQQLMVIGILKEKVFLRKGSKKDFGENALEYMNKRAYLPISTMMHKISPASKIESIEIKTYSPDQSRSLRIKVENLILNLKQGKKIFEVRSAQEQMDAMKQNSLIFTAIFILISVISLLVGGIVIMNIMLASVKERTREIGVRLAIGARRLDIFLQFLVQTVLITSLGGVFGIVIGFLMLGFVSDYLEVTVIASVGMIWTALFVSVGVGLLFGIAPAIRAGNMDPVIALRED
ncbi:MAG: FtsX-like permease family protein, partial [Candidatus Cloacimonetes bacterium]|nr:FtsX-like permease family protein [Candidatus Cloacimonadota bacterium]